MPGKTESWSVERSAETYLIEGWGEPYFRVNEEGRVEVRPHGRAKQGVDLYNLVQDVEARGVTLPMLLRFTDIVEDRIRSLNQCFQRAIKEYEYDGHYQGVYPVKVNQQRQLVEEIVRHGKPWKFGLEAGSKPELIIAMSAMHDSEGLIVCNGYKDVEYIELALISAQVGRTTFVVLERVEELDVVFEASERLGIRPTLGVRSRLNAKGIGKWAESAGDKAKFGLNAAEIVEVVDRLAERDMLDCLQLLHFHIGSQVSSITPFKNALREAAQTYVELSKLGAPMGYLDVGGGLAVDYDGSRTDFHASKNYDMQEYAYDVVASIQDACEKAEIDSPIIISESGRSTVAHHSVLVFDVVGCNQIVYDPPEEPAEDAHGVLKALYETWKGIRPKNIQESWHDAQQGKEEAQSLYKFGYLTLRERAEAERLAWHCGKRIASLLERVEFVPEELQALERVMSDIYYCNFSVFQSAPDTWAIDALFPIMPLHRLEERPTVRARLADLTCDSDGLIDHFIDLDDVKSVLNVHPLERGERYLMGMFLIGAYQETLGDLHNLFGDTNAVHVLLTDDDYDVAHVIGGDSMHQVLKYVGYNPSEMIESVRKQAERALRNRQVSVEHIRSLNEIVEKSLRSTTYLRV